jgi:hypothetical protein
LSVRNTTITGSTGTLGGAIYNSGSGGFLVNNTITGNTSLGNAGAAGAAVQSNGSAPVAVNNIFAGNTGGDVSGSYDSQGGNVIGVVGTATGFFSIADFGGGSRLARHCRSADQSATVPAGEQWRAGPDDGDRPDQSGA